MNALSIFNVLELLDMREVTELDAQLVTCNIVHPDLAFNFIAWHADENCVPAASSL